MSFDVAGITKPALALNTAIADTLPTLGKDEQSSILLRVLGIVGKHKAVLSSKKGINVYTVIGDKLFIKGNMSVYYNGARSTEAIQAILNGNCLKGLKVSEKQVKAQEPELSASDTASQLQEMGL